MDTFVSPVSPRLPGMAPPAAPRRVPGCPRALLPGSPLPDEQRPGGPGALRSRTLSLLPFPNRPFQWSASGRRGKGVIRVCPRRPQPALRRRHHDSIPRSGHSAPFSSSPTITDPVVGLEYSRTVPPSPPPARLQEHRLPLGIRGSARKALTLLPCHPSVLGAGVPWRPSLTAGTPPPRPAATGFIYWRWGGGAGSRLSSRPSLNPGRTWPKGPYSPGPERSCNPAIPLQGRSLQSNHPVSNFASKPTWAPNRKISRSWRESRRCPAKAPSARCGLEPQAAALATYVGDARIPGGSDLPPPLSIILYISRRYTYKQVEILHPTAPFYT